MTRFTLLAMAVLAVAPAWTAAQTATQPPGSNKATQATNNQAAIQRGAPATSTKSTMYEDIEIMRRILLRELHAHQQAFCASCHHSAPGSATPVTMLYKPSTNDDGVASGLIDPGAANGSSSGAPANRNVFGNLDGQANSFYQGQAYDFFQPPFSVNALQNNRNVHASQPAIDIDGAYLADYGVVFHIAVPPLGTAPLKPGKFVPTAYGTAIYQGSTDDWDRIRKEVRGEDANKPKSKGEEKKVDVTDVLLRVMAENGRHFSKLGEKEKLTIIVNFRPAVDVHAKIGRSFLNELLPALDPRGPWTAPQTSIPASPSPFGSTTLRSQGLSSTSGTSQGQSTSTTATSGTGDFELLGDLQIKQGKVQEAIAAYERAVEAQADTTRKSGLYRKLAEAYLKSSGKSDAVTKAIDYLQRVQQGFGPGTAKLAEAEFRAHDRNGDGILQTDEMPEALRAELSKWDRDNNGVITMEEYTRYYAARTQASNPAASNQASAAPHPSRLILTAPKSLLDTAKNMSPEEFRKGVHVERIPIAQTAPPKAAAPVR